MCFLLWDYDGCFSSCQHNNTYVIISKILKSDITIEINYNKNERKDRGMKLSQMRYFSASCHAGNISKAAEELHISQPSVTAAIKALEDELGVSLLHRGNRAVSPTPDGERFLHRCDQILADVDSLEAEFAELSKKHRTINVGIPPMIGSILFPEIFHSFRAKHPNIVINPVEMGSEAAREAVANGTLDLAVVTMGEDVPTRLDALRLTSYDMMYCVGKKHPLAKR